MPYSRGHREASKDCTCEEMESGPPTTLRKSASFCLQWGEGLRPVSGHQKDKDESLPTPRSSPDADPRSAHTAPQEAGSPQVAAAVTEDGNVQARPCATQE